MKVKVHGKDLTVSEDMIERIAHKLSFLDKYILIDVDKSVDKLEDQVRRQKTRLSKRHKEKLAVNFAAAAAADKGTEEIPVRTKRIPVSEMDVEEAIMQMELLDHTFFVFREVDSGIIAIVYKRENGGYGLLEAV